MRSKQPFLSLLLILSLGSSYAYSSIQNDSNGFTLQVAAFPDNAEAQAEEFVNKLVKAGEQPVWGMVEIAGRGLWTRVFLGSFDSQAEARQYGEKLLAERVIKEYVIKKANEIKSLSRPRSVSRRDARVLPNRDISAIEENATPDSTFEKPKPAPRQQTVRPETTKPPPANFHPPPETALARPPTVEATRNTADRITPPTRTTKPISDPHPPQPNQQPSAEPSGATSARRAAGYSPGSASRPMTVAEYADRVKAAAPVEMPAYTDRKKLALTLAPAVDTRRLPRHNPGQIAVNLIANRQQNSEKHSGVSGGLWLSGDVEEGLSRLRWIVGRNNEDLLSLAADGKVQVNLQRLIAHAGVSAVDRAVAPLLVMEYIASNEGLLLLVQMTQSAYRYKLHLGNQVATFQGTVHVGGSINLDTNYDSRINPYRRSSQKLNTELPPFGFDGLIAINPSAKWFNMHTNRLVPVGNITFHELAEAYAKVELEYEYLPKGELPGAHNTAIEREVQLKAQRPSVDLVLTVGSNRVIKSDEELRQLTVELNAPRQEF